MIGRKKNNHDEQTRPEEPISPGEAQGADSRAGGQGGEPDPDATAELIGQLETERDEWRDKYHRALADYKNYQRRALANEREAHEMGMRAVVQSLITPLDHFDLALGQDPSKATAEQIIGGVRVIRDEILKVLQAHGVSLIVPQRGEEFLPMRHEAVMQQQADDVEPGHIVALLQPGYALGERVVRPAKVSVRPGEG